ncbi:MAG: DUF1835 domain-containing protein [Chitinophagaceae bacterium]|nr:DUF1835 domain-containing protein [Chitinophagaceae bacterium]MBL0056849.1 DUF1835 domain-containing protein [Chitinophagaceae bacterium]
MIHLVFQEADIEALRKSFELDESLTGEIVQIKDDFAVGPLGDIYSPAAIEDRKEWWRQVLAGGDYDGLVDRGEVDDNRTVLELKEKLEQDPEQVLWIWAAQNKHDVCGYYWLMSQLKEYPGRVFILYLNNLPFINEKGHIFYPDNLYEIAPREFLKARKLSREVTLSEFEVDPDEWTRICNEHRGIRLLEGGKKLVQEDYDFYDAELRKFITPDWQKASRIINQYLSKSKHPTGDAYLLWRLKVLLASEQYDVQGTVGKMKEFEVKGKEKAAVMDNVIMDNG